MVLALAWVAWRLGEWQFHRLEDRQARNAIVERNERHDPVPVVDVMSTAAPLDAEDEWKRVTATGTYVVEDTVVVRYRTREGAAGVDVVVPLELSDGTSCWWIAAGSPPTTVVPPPRTSRHRRPGR